jgi:hypothetical protein
VNGAASVSLLRKQRSLMWPLYLVMRGLGPRTHEGVCGFKWKNSWVTGPSPVMTKKRKMGTTDNV